MFQFRVGVGILLPEGEGLRGQGARGSPLCCCERPLRIPRVADTARDTGMKLQGIGTSGMIVGCKGDAVISCRIVSSFLGALLAALLAAAF